MNEYRITKINNGYSLCFIRNGSPVYNVHNIIKYTKITRMEFLNIVIRENTLLSGHFIYDIYDFHWVTGEEAQMVCDTLNAILIMNSLTV